MVIKGLCLAVPLIVIGMAAHAAPEASTNTGRITPRPSQTFRGWGMSLAWEAQDLSPRSITTYVIDGLTPRPDVPSGAIEGVVV